MSPIAGALTLVVFFMAFSVNCVRHIRYIPDPESDIEQWVQNFVQQRSFSYRYRLQTQSVYSEAKGDCIIGRGEHVHGTWYYEDKKVHFEYIGLADIEYSKDDGTWHEASRGEESDIITQIKRVLKFDEFEYIDSEEGYVYCFKANIPFLAPGRRKEMVGSMRISRRNFLPEMIWAGLSDSSIYWEIEFYNYNKKKSVKSPLRIWRDYVLSAAANYIKAVKRRLELMDIDYRVKKNGNDIVLSVPHYYTSEDIKAMLSTATLKVYDVVETKEHATKVRYLKNDDNIPLFLCKELLHQNDIRDAKIKLDAASKPYLEILLNKKYSLSSEIAFEVDSVVLGRVILDTSKKIDKISLYTNMQYYEMQMLRASLLQSLPQIDLKPIAEEHN